MNSTPARSSSVDKLKLAAGVLMLSMAALHGGANATELQATGSGQCYAHTYIGCNNTDIHTLANTFTGYYAQTWNRSWFAFDLSAFAGQTITAATLSIWSDANNLPGEQNDLFSLYRATTIDFDGLKSGPALGSVNAFTADDRSSHYVSIALNPAGLAALNSASLLILGGDTTGGSVFFGATNGIPAALLDVQTGPASNVPEPASTALLGLGIVGMVALRFLRRKPRA